MSSRQGWLSRHKALSAGICCILGRDKAAATQAVMCAGKGSTRMGSSQPSVRGTTISSRASNRRHTTSSRWGPLPCAASLHSHDLAAPPPQPQWPPCCARWDTACLVSMLMPQLLCAAGPPWGAQGSHALWWGAAGANAATSGRGCTWARPQGV